MPNRYLRPAIIQTVGLVLLVGGAVFWAATGRQSAMMLSSAVSLIGLGAYAELRHTLKAVVTPAITEEVSQPPWENPPNEGATAPTANA